MSDQSNLTQAYLDAKARLLLNLQSNQEQEVLRDKVSRLISQESRDFSGVSLSQSQIIDLLQKLLGGLGVAVSVYNEALTASPLQVVFANHLILWEVNNAGVLVKVQ